MELRIIKLDQNIKRSLEGQQRRLVRQLNVERDVILNDRKAASAYFERERIKLQDNLSKLKSAKLGGSKITRKEYIQSAVQHRQREDTGYISHQRGNEQIGFTRQGSLIERGEYGGRLKSRQIPRIHVVLCSVEPDLEEEPEEEAPSVFVTQAWTSCLEIPKSLNNWDDQKIANIPLPPRRAASLDNLTDDRAFVTAIASSQKHAPNAGENKTGNAGNTSLKIRPHTAASSVKQTRSTSPHRSNSEDNLPTQRGLIVTTSQTAAVNTDDSCYSMSMNSWERATANLPIHPSDQQSASTRKSQIRDRSKSPNVKSTNVKATKGHRSRIDLKVPIPKSPRLGRGKSLDETAGDDDVEIRSVLWGKTPVVLPARAQSPAGSLCNTLNRGLSRSPSPRGQRIYHECVVDPKRDILGVSSEVVDPRGFGTEVKIGTPLQDVIQIENSPISPERKDFLERALSSSPTPHTPPLDRKIRRGKLSRSPSSSDKHDLLDDNWGSGQLTPETGNGSLRGSFENISIEPLSPNVLSRSPTHGGLGISLSAKLGQGQGCGDLPQITSGIHSPRAVSPSVKVEFFK